MSTVTGDLSAKTVIEMAKNSTGNKYPGVLFDVDDPEMPQELMLGTPEFVEVIFTRPDGVEIRKRGQRPFGGNLGDDNEIFYINRAGDGINDMYGLWRYTVAVVLQDGGKRVRSRESVRWWCVRGDDQPVGPGDAP